LKDLRPEKTMGLPRAVPTAAFDGADHDIWDRVRALAPAGAPMRGVLFGGRTMARGGAVDQPVKAATPPLLEQCRLIDAAWASLPVATPAREGSGPLRGQAICRDRRSAASHAFDTLRTQLLNTLRENNWTRVAVVAPAPGGGATHVACNLAYSISRIGRLRTVLFDLNLRAPGVAREFGVLPVTAAHRFLLGEAPMTQGLIRTGTNLALGPADHAMEMSSELLHHCRTQVTISSVQTALAPDLMLFDLPPMLAYDDLLAFLPQVDGVLLVADATQTTARQISECQRIISGKSKLLGVVLNRSSEKVDVAGAYEYA